MEAPEEHSGTTEPMPGFRRLPSGVRLDDTITSVDAAPAPDPLAERNDDQHRALRDD